MIINATEFKTRAGKYLAIADREEIIITRNGREVAMLVSIKKKGKTPNADFLYGLLSDSENGDTTPEQIRVERINKKYGNPD